MAMSEISESGRKRNSERTVRSDGEGAAASGVEPLREAQVLSPSELYRLQFQVNLHMMDVKALSAIRNRSASDLEAQLRSAS